MNNRQNLVRNEEFWRGKKIRVVLNLADDTVYRAVVVSTRAQAPGKERKRCIRAALKMQNFLECPVANLVAIISNQGEYQPSGWFNREQDIRWHLLSLQDARAIRIE
jgi:hypothetical protein